MKWTNIVLILSLVVGLVSLYLMLKQSGTIGTETEENQETGSGVQSFARQLQ